MKKLVLYSRQSKISGNSNQMTLETSEFTMNHYLSTLGEEGVDYQVIDILREVKSGYSNSSRNRSTFNSAVELCKKHGASLVVSTMSRLSRNTAHGANVLEEIDVIVASSPSANKAMKQIMLVMAEDESEQQSLRRKAVYQAKKKRCEDAGERLVWGASSPKHQQSFQANKANHKKNSLNLKVRDAQQPIVDKVSSIIRYSGGKVTQGGIAKILNEEGVQTVNGKQFTQAIVSRMMKKYEIRTGH